MSWEQPRIDPEMAAIWTVGLAGVVAVLYALTPLSAVEWGRALAAAWIATFEQ